MRERWSSTSIALHWLAAALIIGLAAVGFVMTDLSADSSGRLLMSRMHTLGGATLMLLTLARLVVRRRGPKVIPLPISELHRRGVRVVHGLLYAVTFSIGATGFVTGARSAWPEYLRGQTPGAPALEALVSRQAHEVLVLALLVLVLLHVGGVVVQQLRAGAVLERMVPFISRRSSRDRHSAR